MAARLNKWNEKREALGLLPIDPNFDAEKRTNFIGKTPQTDSEITSVKRKQSRDLENYNTKRQQLGYAPLADGFHTGKGTLGKGRMTIPIAKVKAVAPSCETPSLMKKWQQENVTDSHVPPSPHQPQSGPADTSTQQNDEGGSDVEPEPFIPSDRFVGAEVGYVFKQGPKGVGYYLDDVSLVKQRMREARDNASRERLALLEPPAPSAALTVDPTEALAKIGKSLAHKKKGAKSASLFVKLADAQLSANTSHLFFDTVNAFMRLEGGGFRDLISIGDESFIKAYASLFQCLVAKLELFTDRQRAELCTLSLAGGIICELTTDDTYRYAKAMKKVREALLALTGEKTSFLMDVSDESMLAERREAILTCLETAWKAHTWHWSKPEIETTFQLAAERRMKFSDGQRERLDSLTQRMREGQRKTIIKRAVRAENSTAHPLRNIGKSGLR